MMMFIVSIRKVSKPIYNKEQTYELDGFYADNNYHDSSFMFKSSEFDWIPSQAIGIIGSDEDGIIAETLNEFYSNSKARFSGTKPYKTISFENYKDFSNYIRQYKDVAVTPNITQLWFGAGITRNGKTYSLSVFSNIIPSSTKAPFEQGDDVPKYYGGFQEIRTSHLPTFVAGVSKIIAKRQDPNKQHDFKLAFVPKKTGEYHSDIFSAAMLQTFSPIVVVIFLIPFMNFFQKALEEKVHKIREYMRMMGMKDSAYTASWVIYYVLQIFVIWIEMAIITRIYLTPNSNAILIFLFYFMYGLSLFGWIIGLVALFNNIKTGSAAAIIIHFATYYIVHAVPKAASFSTRCLVSLFPNLALSQGSEILWKLEEEGMGLTFNSIGMTFKNYSMMTYFFMWGVNFFLSVLIGTYLSYVSEQGINCYRFSPQNLESENTRASVLCQASGLKIKEVKEDYNLYRLTKKQSILRLFLFKAKRRKKIRRELR